MLLIVRDHADPSVGMWEQSYKVECPLPIDADPADLETFKQMTIDLYLEFSFGRVTAKYDFEIEEED